MEIIFTKDKYWLEKWDNFVQTNDKGSHLILSDWLRSYESYNFDFEVCLCLENDLIIGGYGAVIAKILFFKFYVVPYGPIVASGHENDLNMLIGNVPERAKKLKACYSHITLPFSSVLNSHVYTDLPEFDSLRDVNQGHIFKYVYSSNGLNWVDLKGFDDEAKIMSLKSSIRRNIRSSYRKGLDFEEIETKDKIKEGYQLFIENSKTSNYNIRGWDEIKECLFALLEKNVLKMLGVYKNKELKGAILLLKTGNYFTYILGGSKKEIPDLRTGDFLQWEAIKISIKNSFDGYNISLGGSKGVVEFKNSFNTEQVLFENSKFHWVLNPFIFKMYLIFDQYMKPYKKKIAKILSMVKI
ncbi:peptidoglycan bridge formation glycyltransferase FemA/FemB family protein [Flavobacterium granuli]|uniref:Lipid II:glycine glycyltransferase (Peptidoglycan interpeptide bridge formation enzyme) n=1 Tax=Flavobacterium granuli TaxID=280093 RepID=A0ABU1S682_9FLAO|nr:peptidoglycan bridge formation glycyltransferase FemA/FemB family protein [Flavobacterium granuli]MDR6846432.1 lipid II:glycine glycyltransferase (peptidoglycan interpeptide bridge formation enzyme) [Flavobacterium granuli]